MGEERRDKRGVRDGRDDLLFLEDVVMDVVHVMFDGKDLLRRHGRQLVTHGEGGVVGDLFNGSVSSSR